MGSEKTEVSVPTGNVLLPVLLTSDLEAVVGEALENVERHAEPGSRSWVLLEDLETEIVFSVRDDGPGIPQGRLTEAEGRMGVVQSIRGRVTSLGDDLAVDRAR